MYSGITQGLFPVIEVIKKPGLIIYSVQLNKTMSENLNIGASVAVDGVCQTVVSLENNIVTFHAMQETLDKTTLSDLVPQQNVSIERSMQLGHEIGGHEVAGHVDGTATIANIETSENNLTLKIQCPKNWMKYIFQKGFIAVDGSSLTVGNTDPNGFFMIHLIPETLRVTNFGNKQVGDSVNIELDYKTKVIVDTTERVLALREGLNLNT
jgi:riboflavin synthase